jgi:hypothetical protein
MRKVKTIIALMALKALLVVFASSLMAQSATNFRSACMEDYRRHCFGVMPGGGRILACLDKHMDELKPACVKAVALGSQCVEDYKELCPDVSPQGSELRACLEQNRARLSSSCVAALTKIGSK